MKDLKATVVPIVFGALGAVTLKLGGWLEQVPGTIHEISIHKIPLLGTGKILHRTLRLPGL